MWSVQIQRFVAFVKPSQQRWAMYFYPLMLVVFEYLMKFLLSIEAGGIIGPSLATVGASFVIALTVKKSLTLKKVEKLRQKLKPSVYKQFIQMYLNEDIYYTDDEEEQVRSTAYAVSLILAMIWGVTLVLTIKVSKDPSASWATPISIVLGSVSCLIGLVLTEWSERKN